MPPCRDISSVEQAWPVAERLLRPPGSPPPLHRRERAPAARLASPSTALRCRPCRRRCAPPAIADRSSSDGAGITRRSAHALRKPRTSSAPSRNPMPRNSSAASGTPADSRPSRKSASRHRSATIRAGRPNGRAPPVAAPSRRRYAAPGSAARLSWCTQRRDSDAIAESALGKDGSAGKAARDASAPV